MLYNSLFILPLLFSFNSFLIEISLAFSKVTSFHALKFQMHLLLFFEWKAAEEFEEKSVKMFSNYLTCLF